MRWLGVGLLMASALAGLIAWFSLERNIPVVIGAAVFFFIGLIILFASGERKSSQKIEHIHTDKKE